MNKTEAECCEVTCVHNEIVRQIRPKRLKEELSKELADFYKVFGDSTRIRILWVLLEAEVCVCDLAEILEMTQSATGVKADEAGEESKRGKDLILLSGRRPY